MVCDWQDRHSAWANSKASECQADLIHTSCRSESSNKSLVVLDKDPISSQTSWPIQNKLGHCWHPVSFLHPTGLVRIQNWNNNTIGLLWLTSKNILSLKRFLRPGNGKLWGLPRRLLPAPSNGGWLQHQMSSHLLPLLVLRLSLNAETSQVNIQILWWGESRRLCFFLQLIWPLSKLPANRKHLFLPGISEDLNFHNTFSEHKLFSCGFLFWMGFL